MNRFFILHKRVRIRYNGPAKLNIDMLLRH